MNAGMKDMLNVMSKYLSMGMTKEDIIVRATWAPAKSIKRADLGQLSEGAVADVAVLSLRNGNFGFVDAGGNKIEGKQKFEAELTIRAGKNRVGSEWNISGEIYEVDSPELRSGRFMLKSEGLQFEKHR